MSAAFPRLDVEGIAIHSGGPCCGPAVIPRKFKILPLADTFVTTNGGKLPKMGTDMRWAAISKYRRQLFLFFVAILAPAAVLVGLSGRLLFQERELAAQRTTEQRQTAVEQFRRELSVRLEEIRLKEINRALGGGSTDAGPSTILTATVKGEKIILPWEAAPAPVSATFGALIYQGEALELGQNRFEAVAVIYRKALGAARSPSETGEAQLALTRTLLQVGDVSTAWDLLHDPSAARAPEGVGYRFYAAQF